VTQALERAAPPGPVRAVLLVVESYLIWYRRNWRSTAVSSVAQPLLFLLAMGFGFGSQVEPGAATGGLRYVVFLAPALLVATTANRATFESAYPVLTGFKTQSKYQPVAATPVTPAQIALGLLAWMALRLAGVGLIYLAVAAVLGALTGPAVLLALVAAVLTGMVFSAFVVALTATLRSDWPFNALFRFVVLPMALFAGVFFPVDVLPAWLRPVVWATPMWHGTELARGWTFGGLDLWPALGHLAYLTALVATGTWLCCRFFRRRLAT
jgi:lipooligosaccharide transport system permease protein